MNNNFFVINAESFKDKPTNQHTTLTAEQFNQAVEVKWIVDEKHILIDCDSQDATNTTVNVLNKLNKVPYWYWSRLNTNAHYWFTVDENARVLIDKFKLNSSSHKLSIHNDIDTRAFNTTTQTTGAVYLKRPGKDDSTRPDATTLLENLETLETTIPLILLMPKQFTQIPASGDNWSNAAIKLATEMKNAGLTYDIYTQVLQEWATVHGDTHDEPGAAHKWKDARTDKELMMEKLLVKRTELNELIELGLLTPKSAMKEIEQYREKLMNNFDIDLLTPFEQFFKRTKTGEITGVKSWDELNETMFEDNNWKKLNGVIVNDKNEPVKKNDITTYLHKNANNVPPQVAKAIIERTNQEKSIIIKPEPNFIVCTNGKFNIKTGEFITGEFESINKINWAYDPEAKSAKGKEIFNRYIGDNIGFDTQVFEAVGLMMAQHYDLGFKKAIFFDGASNYGKNFLFDKIIMPTIGEANIGIIDFTELSEKENISFLNKTCVYDQDANNSYLDKKTITQFKKVTGGTKLKAKILYQDVFAFDNHASIWVNTNGLPDMNDLGSGGAIKNRIHVINATVNVKAKYGDKDVYTEVSTNIDNICPWLLKEALHALHKAYVRKELTTTVASRKTMDARETNDSVKTFLSNYFNRLEIGVVFKRSELYAKYEQTFMNNGINQGANKVNKTLLFKGLEDFILETSSVRVYKSAGNWMIKKIKQTEGTKTFTQLLADSFEGAKELTQEVK